MPEGLTLDGVRIGTGGRMLVTLDTHVPPGGILTVMGPSGAGKSTLLRWLTGTLPAGFDTTGRAILNGRDVTDLPPHRRRVGILFQDDVLFPHLSVGGNLMFGMRHARDRAARVARALDRVGLSGAEERDPATLSGGERARVALMRMLLSEPEAVLLDEAFSGLDHAMRDRIRRLTFDEAAARHLPVLMVTHDPGDAQAAGGPVARIGEPAR